MAHVVLEHAASMDSLLSDTDLDIATLLSVGQEESVDEISSHFHHHGVQPLVGVRFTEESQVANYGREKTESPLAFANVFAPFVKNHRKEEGSVEEESWDVVELRGSDVGETNVIYQVQGLRSHEMPVIGESSHIQSLIFRIF